MKKHEQSKHKIKRWNKDIFGDVRINKTKFWRELKIDEEEVIGELREYLKTDKQELRNKLGDLLLKELISWN